MNLDGLRMYVTWTTRAGSGTNVFDEVPA